ncbi:MAG: hypothetical protein WC761_00750 [Candidatus Paceibacterota bacterium]|jgi:hypothetical protein
MTITQKKTQMVTNYQSYNRPVVDSHSAIGVKLIGQFQEVVSLGFSEENWDTAARILWDFARLADKKSVDALGNLMTEMYVYPSFTRIQEVCEQVSSHFVKYQPASR